MSGATGPPGATTKRQRCFRELFLTHQANAICGDRGLVEFRKETVRTFVGGAKQGTGSGFRKRRGMLASPLVCRLLVDNVFRAKGH